MVILCKGVGVVGDLRLKLFFSQGNKELTS